MNLSLSTWAIAPLAVVLREHARADQVRLTLLRDGPIYERVHVEAVYRDGHCEETTVHETPGVSERGLFGSESAAPVLGEDNALDADQRTSQPRSETPRDPRRRPVDPNECQTGC